MHTSCWLSVPKTQAEVASHGADCSIIMKANACLITMCIDFFIAPCYLTGAVLQLLREGGVEGKLQLCIVEEGFVCCHSHAGTAEVESLSNGC